MNQRVQLTVGISALFAMWPAFAAASDGAAAENGSMVLLLTILGAIGGAYLVAHFLVDRLQRRFLFTSGAEYVLLGVLLGSSTGVLSDHAALAPVLAFGTGWIGLLDGVGLRIERLQRLQRWSMRLALVELLVVGGGVAAASWALFRFGLNVDPHEAQLSGGVLGCAAASGARSASRLLSKRFPQLAPRVVGDVPLAAATTEETSPVATFDHPASPDSVLRLVDDAARLSQTLAILAFGALVCVFHPENVTSERTPVASEWILLTIGLGFALGGLFRLLISNESTDNQRFMALVGIISFATGAAFFLDLSALAVNLLLGFVLVQGSRGVQLEATLTATLGPVMLLLLVLAGVVWTPVNGPMAVGLIGLVWLGRVVLKLLAGFVAAAGTPVRPDIGRGLLAQGSVALCIALSYRLVYQGPVVDMVFTAILVSVIVSEAVAPRLLKGLLVDAGELRQDVAMEPAAPAA